MSKAKILCVDDEPRVLEGLQRVLMREFQLSTATSGDTALAYLKAGESFAVIVSDMRMPKMNGAALLAAFREQAPDTVRVLLTGHSDVDTAAAAVNQGQIFRFLTKPCGPDVLIPTLRAAVEQHRLVTAERVLLEQTLVGSVRAMTEVLALTHPELFGRGPQRYERARALAERLAVPDPWHVEVACMLASIGYGVLPNDVTVKLSRGEALDATEANMLRQVPVVAERVVSHIPRLERVKDLLQYQSIWLFGAPSGGDGALPIAARILRAVHDLGSAEVHLGTTERALDSLRQRFALYGDDVLQALSAVCDVAPELREMALHEIRPGMILAEDVKLATGTLLVSKGQRVTEQLLTRLDNFRARGLKEPILCQILPGNA